MANKQCTRRDEKVSLRVFDCKLFGKGGEMGRWCPADRSDQIDGFKFLVQ